MDSADPQLELPLTGSATGREPGLDRWRAERTEALRALSRKLGFPLGHHAEVLLRDGTRLRGELRLAEDDLWVETRRDFRVLLRIDRCTFTAEDIESCLRLD